MSRKGVKRERGKERGRVSIYFSSGPFSSPSILSAANISCNITSLSWLPLPCSDWVSPFSRYSVKLFRNQICHEPLEQEYSSLEPFLNISYSRPFTNYCVQVSHVNIGNHTGPYSQGLQIKSPECRKLVIPQ